MTDDRESASLVARKTPQWRETLWCWVVVGFEYSARAAAMREGHAWHPMLPVKTDSKQPSLDSGVLEMIVLSGPLLVDEKRAHVRAVRTPKIGNGRGTRGGHR